MKKSVVIIAAVPLALSVAAPPAFATSGGDRWVIAQQSEQVGIVRTLNEDLTANDGVLHPASCYSISQLAGHQSVASVALRQRASEAQCGTAKEFGVYVLRKVKGHWTILATATGRPGSTCTYVAYAPTTIKAILAKTGPCYV